MALGGLFPSPAMADRGRVHDPNDTPGILDVKSIAQRHRGARRLLHTARTFRAWKTRELPRNQENYLGFYFYDGTDDSEADRFVWVRRSRHRGLTAKMYRPLTHPNGEFLGRVRVWRPGHRSVRISLRPRQLGRALSDGYRWRVMTSFESDDSTRCRTNNRVSSFPIGTCFDNAPRLRRAGLRHNL